VAAVNGHTTAAGQTGGDPGAVAEVGSQQPVSSGQQPALRLLVKQSDSGERVDPAGEQHLGLVDVPDAGHDPLVQQHRADLGVRSGQLGHAAEAGIQVRFGQA